MKEEAKKVPQIVRLAITESPLLEDRIKNLTHICELLSCETNCKSIKDALDDIIGFGEEASHHYLVFKQGDFYWFTNFDEESWGVNDYYGRTPNTGVSPDIHNAITDIKIISQLDEISQVSRSNGIKVRDFAELLGEALRLEKTDPFDRRLDLDEVEGEKAP